MYENSLAAVTQEVLELTSYISLALGFLPAIEDPVFVHRMSLGRLRYCAVSIQVEGTRTPCLSQSTWQTLMRDERSPEINCATTTDSTTKDRTHVLTTSMINEAL